MFERKPTQNAPEGSLYRSITGIMGHVAQLTASLNEYSALLETGKISFPAAFTKQANIGEVWFATRLEVFAGIFKVHVTQLCFSI